MSEAFHDYDISIGQHRLGKSTFGEDLLYGQAAEGKVQDILTSSVVSIFDHTKIEVKCDRMAHRTGNLFFEYRYKGRPSGIAITKAEWFAYDTGMVILFFRTEPLRAFLRRTYRNPYQPRALGDGAQSIGLLVPLRDIAREALT